MLSPNLMLAIFLLTLDLLSTVSFYSPLVAMKKGYSPYYWMFACGPVGLVIVCCLRSLRSAETPEQREQMKAGANLIGRNLTGIAMVVWAALFALFVSLLVMGAGSPPEPAWPL